MENDKSRSIQPFEKLDPSEDFFDTSSIWGKWFAKRLVKQVLNTPVTPPQLTLISFIAGITAAYFLGKGPYWSLIIGAIFIHVKNIFDTADGHLARARNAPSRIGRFLDSITDFITNIAFFIGIGWNLMVVYPPVEVWILCAIAFLSSSLQCSYYVYYTISYMIHMRKSTASRVDESIQEKDYKLYKHPRRQKILIYLQKTFLLFYGWQDRMMKHIDLWSLPSIDKNKSNWYLDRPLLTKTSILGLGNQLSLISFFALINQLYLYLWIITIAGNLYWFFLILFRRIKFKNQKDIL